MTMRNILIAVVVAFVGIGSLLVYDYNQFMDAPFSIASGDTMRIDVAPGRSITSIANELKSRGVIGQSVYLAWTARINGQARHIQAGEYAINSEITPRTFLTMLVDGKVIQYSFTIIDGWNTRQVLEALKSNTDVTHSLDDVTPKQLMKKIGLPSALHAEGWLFPDTYYFVRGESDVSILLRAHKAMQVHINREWKKRDTELPYDSPYDALIMASIVEKETGKADERQQIAGVFVRRLRKGMKLQTDPTVIYGLGSKYNGNIRRRDLRADTPYNTYTRKGMPPTPIAMPGLASIQAALHPDNGTALYFVAKGDGSHVFSDNLKQHNEAVIKYQLKGRRKAFSSFPGDKKKQ